MPKSIYAHAVDDIQAALRPSLHDQGFRVRGRTFHRVTEDGLTQVINIQMGTSTPPGTTYSRDRVTTCTACSRSTSASMSSRSADTFSAAKSTDGFGSMTVACAPALAKSLRGSVHLVVCSVRFRGPEISPPLSPFMHNPHTQSASASRLL